jgi:hypothetical protein
MDGRKGDSMASFQARLALRTAATLVGAGVLTWALASEPEANDCKPSPESTHPTYVSRHLQALVLHEHIQTLSAPQAEAVTGQELG